MARNLGFGSILIRILLVAGLLLSSAGMLLGNMPPIGLRILFAVIGLINVAVLAVLASRKLTARVKELAAVMDKAAEGDLTIRGNDNSPDEVGMLNNNFNEMLNRLSAMMLQLRNASEELRSIGGSLGTVSGQGVTLAETQSHASKSTKDAAIKINHAVEEAHLAVERLSEAATANSDYIQQMTSSTSEINQLVEQLVSSVEEVGSSIARMASVQKEINSGVNRLKENSSKTSTLVLEMDHSVRQIEDNAQATAKISADVLRDAEFGNVAVESTINGIEQIRHSSKTVQTAIENLSVHAASIGTILQVIDEVTEQTKLLALNASIIAAQAGEHGKGFGVVAHEIKELARRTTASTREIAEIVNGVKDETEKAVMAIRVSEEAVGEGELLSRKSGDALRKIVDGVKTATHQVKEIAHTTELHAQQSDNMRLAVSEVAAMVEQIVRASSDQTRDTEIINHAAGKMRELVSRVHSHAKSHNSAGSSVVGSSDTIMRMISEICHSCAIQKEASKQIVEAAEETESTATGNLETTRVMEAAVSGLSGQIRALDREVAGFRIS